MSNISIRLRRLASAASVVGNESKQCQGNILLLELLDLHINRSGINIDTIFLSGCGESSSLILWGILSNAEI